MNGLSSSIQTTKPIWTTLLPVIITAAVHGFLTGCTTTEPASIGDASLQIFEEITEAAGLNIVHSSGSTSDYPMPQSMGSGCALIDVNVDGLLDIVVVAGASADAATSPNGDRYCAVWLQKKDGKFQDFTTEAGLLIRAFGMGVAAADADNDGDPDMVITTSEGSRFFVNDGTGRFNDTTPDSGIGTSRWATAAAFFDYDIDGWLDLMIVNYVDYIPGSICEDGAGRRDYCGPLAFQGTVDRLYRNLGASGRLSQFEDVTVVSGLTSATTKGLGVVCSDLTGDGRPDIYVANDSEPNRLWVQQQDGTFQDEADLRGCAVDAHYRPQASMGTIWSDLDQDGLMDLFLTHLRGESNTLYHQVSEGIFVDQTAAAGLGQPSLNFTGFGTAAADLDHDGFTDLLVANGKVMRSALLKPAPRASHWDEYVEVNQIFLGRKGLEFDELRSSAEPFTQVAEVSRGLAVGDIDNDGDLDVLISNTDSVTRLYRNKAAKKGRSLTVEVLDGSLNRHSVGARVRVRCGDREWVREVQPNVGYLSSNDPRLHFGLADAAQYDFIEVLWPGQPRSWERFQGGGTDRLVKVIRGAGKIQPSISMESTP